MVLKVIPSIPSASQPSLTFFARSRRCILQGFPIFPINHATNRYLRQEITFPPKACNTNLCFVHILLCQASCLQSANEYYSVAILRYSSHRAWLGHLRAPGEMRSVGLEYCWRVLTLFSVRSDDILLSFPLGSFVSVTVSQPGRFKGWLKGRIAPLIPTYSRETRGVSSHFYLTRHGL